MADNAASVIRTAIANHAGLSARNIEVYPTGSYHNNTNVRGESDIDVAVVCHDSIFFDLPPGDTAAKFGISTPAAYSFEDFRQDVHDALAERFGSGMTPGDKAFNVHENTYRLEADVTPFFEYRKYSGEVTAQNTWAAINGVKSIGASGGSFINYHIDHYDQGVKRNKATGLRFKRITRIIKNVKFDMIENGTAAAKAVAEKMPSFLIECLVFNAPDNCFKQGSDGYVEDVRCVIADLWNRTKATGDAVEKMVEVNYRKWLFRGGQDWQVETVHEFLLEAWRHLFP
jgi:predicted nucleotidyltransferase